MADDAPLSPDELDGQIPGLLEALGKESPLDCVLIATSFLEQCLSTLVRSFLISPCTTADGLFHYRKGTLKDMRSRANIAYCCGLIDKGLYTNLCEIGEIRNRFAHLHFAIDFSDSEIIERCNKLKMDRPRTYASTAKARTVEDTFADIGATPRGRFVIVACLAALSLLHRARSATRCKLPEQTWDVAAPPIT